MTSLVTENLTLVAGAPNGIAKLREQIQELAVRGKLVSQDARDESASLLLAHIASEKLLFSKPARPVGSMSATEQRHVVPHGWSWARLGSLVLDSGAGWSPSCEPRPREGDEWGVLKVSAVSWAAYQPEENKALPANLNPRPEHEVQPGDFLVSRANTEELVARSVVVESTPPRLMLSDKIVRLKLSQSCNRRFVNLANSCPDARRYYSAVAGGTSSSMKNVSREQILNLPIPVPPLAEQHRIVAKVDELMALCDRLEAEQADAEAAHAKLVEALLASLTQARDAADFRASWQQLAEHFHTLFTTEASVDTLEKAILELAVSGKLTEQQPTDGTSDGLIAEIDDHRTSLIAEGGLRTSARPEIPLAEQYLKVPVNWRYCRLGNLARFIDYRGKTPVKTSSGVPLITAKNVRFGYISREPREFIASEGYAPWMTRGIPRPGDMLFTTEAPLGNIAIIDIAERFALAQRVICFQLHRMQTGPFLRIALMSQSVQAAIAEMATGMTATGVKASKLKELPIPLPPVAEQQRIVGKVEQLMELCACLRTEIAKARQHHEHLASVLVG